MFCRMQMRPSFAEVELRCQKTEIIANAMSLFVDRECHHCTQIKVSVEIAPLLLVRVLVLAALLSFFPFSHPLHPFTSCTPSYCLPGIPSPCHPVATLLQSVASPRPPFKPQQPHPYTCPSVVKKVSFQKSKTGTPTLKNNNKKSLSFSLLLACLLPCLLPCFLPCFLASLFPSFAFNSSVVLASPSTLQPP